MEREGHGGKVSGEEKKEEMKRRGQEIGRE